MDFIEEYIIYNKDTEPPYNYHRWCAISCVGAILGRNYYIQHGSFRIFPNIYTLLIGEAATRKSTAVKINKRLLSSSGYETFAADKTTKEKFLLDLEGSTDAEIALASAGPGSNSKRPVYDSVMATNLWGSDSGLQEPREVFIEADEFAEFVGSGNLEFYTTLGNLWDWDDEKQPFTQRVKNSKSVSIFQPTVSILGGITPELFARAFPPEAIGSGFLSRMILIHGEKSARKYPFPPTPSSSDTEAIIATMRKIRSNNYGVATVTPEALGILGEIYHGWDPISDVRFKAYSNRRFTQLLKLCLIVSAAQDTKQIVAEHIIRANTYLSAAESLMPRALGEFGKSKNSDVANKIMDVLKATHKPLSAIELWKHVHKDLEKIHMLSDILQSLKAADRVQYIKDKGWLPLEAKRGEHKFVDWSLLTEEERDKL